MTTRQQRRDPHPHAVGHAGLRLPGRSLQDGPGAEAACHHHRFGLDQFRPAEARAGRDDLQPRGLCEGHRGPAGGTARGQDPAADLLGRRRRHQPSRRCLSRHHRRDRQASAAGTSSSPRSMPTSTRATSPASSRPAASSRSVRCRRSTSARSMPPPSSWRRWAPSRSSRRSTKAKASTWCVSGRVLRSLADRGDGDPRRLRSGARLAHGQDHGMRRALRRAGRPQRHGLSAARSFRDRAAQSRRALHHGLGGRPHALRKDPSLPAGRPRRHARSVQLQVRAGDRPARARLGQPLRAVQALHGEARRREDLGLAQHLHRRRARSDLHRPDRRDPRQGAGRHARLLRRGAGGELPHHPPPLRQERRDGRRSSRSRRRRTSFASSSRSRRRPSRSPPRSAARRAPA